MEATGSNQVVLAPRAGGAARIAHGPPRGWSCYSPLSASARTRPPAGVPGCGTRRGHRLKGGVPEEEQPAENHRASRIVIRPSPPWRDDSRSCPLHHHCVASGVFPIFN